MIRWLSSVLQREINAFFHMRHDDQGAHRWREIIMRVALEAHVLGEVFRLHQFADIVEIGTDRQSVAFAPIASAAASARLATTRL